MPFVKKSHKTQNLSRIEFIPIKKLYKVLRGMDDLLLGDVLLNNKHTKLVHKQSSNIIVIKLAYSVLI